MNGNAKYKFMASVAFLFLLPFLVLSLHFARGYGELERRDTLGRMALRTRAAANAAADLMALNYNVSSLSASPGFIDASGEARKKMLENRIKENPSIYSEFAVLDGSGKVKCRAGQSDPKSPGDYSKTELLKSAVAARSPSGAVEYGEYTPPVLVLLAPLLRGRDAKPEGFLVVRMSLAYLGAAVRDMGRNSYGDLGLLDAGGQVISDSLGYSVMAPGVKAGGEVLHVVNAAVSRQLSDFKTEIFYKGKPYFVSISNVQGTRWWLFETIDASNPLRYATSFWVKRVILTGVLLVLIFSFISYRLALRWLAPRPERAVRWL
jgi:hypothetical protein